MLRVLSVIDVERGDAPLSITHEVTLFKCKVLLIAGLSFGQSLVLQSIV
jgi:hypothetical protein